MISNCTVRQDCVLDFNLDTISIIFFFVYHPFPRHLTWSRSHRKQARQFSWDVLLPSHISQLLLVYPETFSGHMGCIIPPVCSGSSPPGLTCPENFHSEASSWDVSSPSFSQKFEHLITSLRMGPEPKWSQLLLANCIHDFCVFWTLPRALSSSWQSTKTLSPLLILQQPPDNLNICLTSSHLQTKPSELLHLTKAVHHFSFRPYPLDLDLLKLILKDSLKFFSSLS